MGLELEGAKVPLRKFVWARPWSWSWPLAKGLKDVVLKEASYRSP